MILGPGRAASLRKKRPGRGSPALDAKSDRVQLQEFTLRYGPEQSVGRSPERRPGRALRLRLPLSSNGGPVSWASHVPFLTRIWEKSSG